MTEEDAREFKASNPGVLILDERDLIDQAMRARCASLYQRLCGQRSPRDEWVDISDVTVKDTLPVEKIFRREHPIAKMDHELRFDRTPRGRVTLLSKSSLEPCHCCAPRS